MTHNADYERVIRAGREIAGWLESISEDLTEDEATTAMAVSDALLEWEQALAHIGRSEP